MALKKKQLTDRLGYDGGAFYSHDGSKISGELIIHKRKKKYLTIKIYYLKVQFAQWPCNYG
ncbi:MAG: hypothetical protein CM1200mP10_04200 [Candidatus Neomarinimicrobiota bacterium]|nr:MAG: hypothetical protein CM1200mP10_04200 [Candidatus Neomarinimicrobiota bacterium]